MRIGQIAVGRKRSLRIQFSPERVLDMPILRAEIPEPWRPRRLRRAARALRKQGVKRVLVPAGFAQWDTLESAGLGPVETGEFCRAMAPAVALAALTGAHIRPEGATVVLRGERVTRAMRMSALKLCPEVKNLLIAAPVGGAGLQAELRREYGGPGGCARARTGSGHPFCALRRRRCQDRGPVREQPPDGSFFLCPAGTDPAGGL